MNLLGFNLADTTFLICYSFGSGIVFGHVVVLIRFLIMHSFDRKGV